MRNEGGGFAAQKGSQPRLAADTPSFLWKEVPRRGGSWMGEAVFPYHSLPRVGKVASKASRIGF